MSAIIYLEIHFLSRKLNTECLFFNQLTRLNCLVTQVLTKFFVSSDKKVY